jgi:hypothetical protein
MKKFYTLLLSLVMLAGIGYDANAQSLTVSGSLFLPQDDSIGFTYDSPSFSETDWIGIYRIDDLPGGPASVSWNYIPAASGTLYLSLPQEAGEYKAYLLCCDGYDIIAMSESFTVAVPVLTSSQTAYLQGDSLVFTYVSPRFTSADWIGLYTTGTKPGSANPSIDWKYLPDSAGTMTFKTTLNPGFYDAYLLCCDGYDSLAACTFEIKSANVAFVTPKSMKFPAGSPLEFVYNVPAFATGDWIGIYNEGDDPALVSSVAWSYLASKSGIVTFAGTLIGGNYFAVIYCCNGSETEYARSAVFEVEAGTSGTYIKTAASVYPQGVPILVNFRDMDFVDTDWIGIYKKGEAPGGGPAATLWVYAPSDSGTVAFSDPLLPGEYIVYLLCCDAYNIKAKYNFKVSDSSTPSVVASAMTYATTDSLVFYFNSPSYVDTDWIGIYHPGDVPGDVGSITWKYLPAANGTMTFKYPDDHDLAPGEYWAGLFCCDGYDLYAQTSFIITEGSSGIQEIKFAGNLSIFPNPTNGQVTVNLTGNEKPLRISVYSLTGQVLYQDKLDGSVEGKVLDLNFLNKGVYFIEIQTGKSKLTRKLIIH